jgi:hypothetical protein
MEIIDLDTTRDLEEKSREGTSKLHLHEKGVTTPVINFFPKSFSIDTVPSIDETIWCCPVTFELDD